MAVNSAEWPLITASVATTRRKMQLSEATGITRVTLESIDEKGIASDVVCEKLYSYIYERNYRLNSVKEELTKEKYGNVVRLKQKQQILNLVN